MYHKSLKFYFFIKLWITFKVASTSTTTTLMPDESFEECPMDFTFFEDKCYVNNSTTCPYYLPLPFDQYQSIAENLTGNYKLDIIKINDYYYQWVEILGNYGQLFVENFIQSDDIFIGTTDSCVWCTVPTEGPQADDNFSSYVIANYNDPTNVTYFTTSDSFTDYVIANYSDPTNVTYFTTSENYTSICAYPTLNQSKTTYCQLFDNICTNNTGLDSTNCHCYNRTESFFCELNCTDSDYNITVCEQCDTIFAAYKSPQISLSFNFIKRVIYVSVTSFLKLLPLNDVSNAIVYCYTDAEHNPHDVRFRYDVNISFEEYNRTYKNIHYTLVPRNYSIGHYYCEGFRFSSDGIFNLPSDVIIAQNGTFESFTINITVYDSRTYPFKIHEETEENIRNEINTSNLKHIINQIRFLHLYPINSTSNISYRLYFNTNTTMEYVLNQIDQIFNPDFEKSNVTFSPSYCLNDTTTENNVTLTWPTTLLGMTAIPNELCLKNDSKPVTRTCLGEYLYGTYWSDVDGVCVNNSGELFGSDKTIQLHDLSHSEISDKIEDLQQILKNQTETPITVDVHFMAQIIENFTLGNVTNCNTSIGVLSDIMDTNREVLKDAQTLLNSTDMLIYNLDMILSKCKIFHREYKEYSHFITKNIYVQVSTLSDGNVTGAAIYENDGVTIQPLHSDFELDNLNTLDLKLVVFITGTQLQQIRYSNDTKLVITVFRHDSLFNAVKNPETTGYLVGVYVDGFEEPFLYDSVRVVIKPDRKYRADLNCAFWNYGRDKLWYNRHGTWAKGLKAKPYKNLHVCENWKMGHFGMLLGHETPVVLSILAAIGSALSMFGCGAVIMTGFLYKQWCETSGTKILLNFVVTNFLQNIILAVSSEIDSYQQETLCIIVGACLHYSVISQFTWMTIIAYLQYMRYVQVFYVVGNRFVMISSIISWLLPVIPVSVVLGLNKCDYVQEKFCYLQDLPLKLGVFLPLGLTLTVNTVIFVIILYNINYKKRDPMHRDNMSWLNLRLIILLFFLFGFYWFFGIAARFARLIVFDYFFCISASMQGIVLFLYFIVFNKMTRNFWLRQLKRSEMISTMQIWLQQRKKLGRVKLDSSRHRKTKISLVKMLQKKKTGRIKLA